MYKLRSVEGAPCHLLLRIRPEEGFPAYVVIPILRYACMMGTGSVSSTSNIVMNTTFLHLSYLQILVLAQWNLVQPVVTSVVLVCWRIHPPKL